MFLFDPHMHPHPSEEACSAFLEPLDRCRRSRTRSEIKEVTGLGEDHFVFDIYHLHLPVVGLGQIISKGGEKLPPFQFVMGRK